MERQQLNDPAPKSELTWARWLEQSRAGLSGRELRPLGRDQCAGPELPLCGGSCGGSLPAQKELGASFRPPSVLGLILGGGTCLRPGAGSGRRVCGFRATQAGALGFVSRLQDPDNRVFVWEGSLVRRLDQLAWSQTQGPFGLTRTPSVHGTPGGSRARSLHQRAAAPRVAGLVPETGWHPSSRASPVPGLSPGAGPSDWPVPAQP